MLHAKLPKQRKGCREGFKNKIENLKKAVSLYLLTSTAQQPSVMFDTYGQIWDVPAVPAYRHSSTPSCLQNAHTLTLHSTSCFPSPLYSTLSCPSPSPPLPSSNSLPRTNPGGLSHRWVWAGLTSAWHCLECLGPRPLAICAYFCSQRIRDS